MPLSFETRYPHIAYFVASFGWIELGNDADGPLTSMIRAIDPGGMVWEGNDQYPTVDEAFEDLEHGLAAWFRAEGIVIEE